MNLLSVIENSILQEQETTKQELLQLNDITQKYALTLSTMDIETLMHIRDRCLQKHGIFDITYDALETLIFVFCDSLLIPRQQFLLRMEPIIDFFYALKRRLEINFSDADIIEAMHVSYHHKTFGEINKRFEKGVLQHLEHQHNLCLEVYYE